MCVFIQTPTQCSRPNSPGFSWRPARPQSQTQWLGSSWENWLFFFCCLLYLVISSCPGTMWASITLASMYFRSITCKWTVKQKENYDTQKNFLRFASEERYINLKLALLTGEKNIRELVPCCTSKWEGYWCSNPNGLLQAPYQLTPNSAHCPPSLNRASPIQIWFGGFDPPRPDWPSSPCGPYKEIFLFTSHLSLRLPQIGYTRFPSEEEDPPTRVRPHTKYTKLGVQLKHSGEGRREGHPSWVAWARWLLTPCHRMLLEHSPSCSFCLVARRGLVSTLQNILQCLLPAFELPVPGQKPWSYLQKSTCVSSHSDPAMNWAINTQETLTNCFSCLGLFLVAAIACSSPLPYSTCKSEMWCYVFLLLMNSSKLQIAIW